MILKTNTKFCYQECLYRTIRPPCTYFWYGLTKNRLSLKNLREALSRKNTVPGDDSDSLTKKLPFMPELSKYSAAFRLIGP